MSEMPAAIHSMHCPHCGHQALIDDKAGGLHCLACGHETQMGWDSPDDWLEGKFNWDFNLPLEGMSELREEPGDQWVVPTRDYGPRRVGGIEEWDTMIPYEEEPLYHGYNSSHHLDKPFAHGWLTSEPKEAFQYASERQDRVRPFRVRLERPLHMTAAEAGMGLITGQLLREAQEAGHDGVVVHKQATEPNEMEPSQEWGEARHVIPFDYGKVQPATGENTRTGSKTASINARKFYTTAEDHERGKLRWGLPRSHAHRTAAVDPAWLQKWIEINGPYMVHETDAEDTREKILREGLVPHDNGVGSNYSGSLVPRSNHAYLSRNLHTLAPLWGQANKITRNAYGEPQASRRSVAIDLRKLDPARVNADEDSFNAMASYRSRVPVDWLREPEDITWPTEHPMTMANDATVEDQNGRTYRNWGEWADQNNVIKPEHTAWSMNTMGNAAVEGGVSPEALVRPVDAWNDLEQNYPHAIPPGYGRFHTPIAPPEAPRAPSPWQMPKREPTAEQPVQGEVVARVAMPVSPEFWEFGPEAEMTPKALYHGTSADRLESIMQHGLHPWDSDVAGGSNYGLPSDTEDDYNPNPSPWLIPRPGHVYLSQDPYEAHARGLNAEIARYPEGTNVEEQVYNPKTITFKVDPSYLRAEHINPDEDYMPGASFDERGPASERKYRSLGEMAERMGWGDIPSETERHIVRGKHIAYRGAIPPEALTPGRVKNGEWQPLQVARSAALIGDMRDGFGRYATAAPWEFGKWGKGLFFPETDHLVLWSDERGHSDVWAEDEFGNTPGPTHHLIVRPDGTVRDQGSFDREFGTGESFVPELAQALQEYDPRLKLDKSDDWEFGPTEPMEEEPSSISRGEEGGKDSPTLQTSNDFAGSL